jgi:hypothetical protein
MSAFVFPSSPHESALMMESIFLFSQSVSADPYFENIEM